VRANGSRINPILIQQAVETIMNAVDTYREELSNLPEDGEVRQSHIAVAHFAGMAKGALSDLEAVFSTNALRLKDSGTFEPGDLLVAFELMKGRRSPRWKEEAVKQAKLYADFSGQNFNEAQYVELVSANTPKSADKHKPIIREAANGGSR